MATQTAGTMTAQTTAAPRAGTLFGFWTLQIAGWTVYGLSTYLATFPNLEAGQYLLVLFFKVVRTAIGFASSLLLWQFLRRLERAGAGRGRLGAAVIGASLLLGVVWLLAYREATAPFRPEALPSVPWAVAPRAALDYAFVLLAWSAVYLGARLYGRTQREERRALEAASRAQEIEFAMLRYQLDPHFLFNALNSLRATIPLTADMARDLVDEFSDFLRHTLHRSPSGEVRLHDEIDAIRSYLAIERVRFADGLETEVSLAPDAAAVRIPIFLVHPLVENAVKHGMASGARPLRISVRAAVDQERATVIEVVNSLGSITPRHVGRPGRYGRPGGLGVGLENVRRRLDLSYGERASFEFRRGEGSARAVIRIEKPTEAVR
jgi:hypothetical protein